MRRISFGFAVAVMAVVAVHAAELPTIKPAKTEHYKTCNVGGMAGYLIPGSDTCVKLGGYISGGIEVGNVKPQSHN